MALRNASEIDKNFALPTKITREGLVYRDAAELDLYGLCRIDGVYRRMKYEDAAAVSENVALISSECAGGRIRFITDSPYIAIFVKYRSVSKVPNYSCTATMGFDLYSSNRYIGCYIPPLDTSELFESIIDVPDFGEPREYTLNFPVCSEIEEVHIGIKDTCILSSAPKYAIQTPIVFYGSSTTQGACASRPGNTYENMISRSLDCDYINLGFWGNAKGEEEMARYISKLDMSAFVYDYDYNAPSAEHLEATHERMFRIVREAKPTLPIVILSAPKCPLDDEHKKRLSIIERTYKNAVAKGDSCVRFISGEKMLADVKDRALADNIHPGDVGFSAIAEHVTLALRDLLKI